MHTLPFSYGALAYENCWSQEARRYGVPTNPAESYIALA